MNGKQIVKILKQNGWEIIRSEASHFRLAKGDKRATVPVHGSKDLKA